MSSSAPIGVFDSGLGGISVARQIAKDMPAEHVLYFGDSANAPYGIKTPEQVRALSFDIVERFVRQGVKAVVIACNTATSAAVNDLREHYDIPIIGMEPALKVACDRGDVPSDPHHIPQRVIVAATPLTLRERKFAKLMDRFDSNNTIFKEPCPDLVEIVESGRLGDHDLVMRTLHGYFDQYDMEHIDSVVLGCTHFVFYRDYFRELLPERAAVIDGNEGTVRHLGVVLDVPWENWHPRRDRRRGARQFRSVRTDCRVVTQIAERMSRSWLPSLREAKEEPDKFTAHCPYRCPCSTRKLIPDSSEQGVGMTKTAMIDVGGGFRAIFGCGVMDRMLEDGIDVDMCYGVSAGAANMTSFIARQHGRNHTFYTKYAFRKEYASAESFFKNHNFANLDYIYGTLSNHDGENPLDFAAFEANETGFTVVACNAEDGSTKYFDKSRVRFDDFDIIKASSAVPVACEPYVVDGVPYFDGGIADPVPVQKALEDGYDRVILILSRLRNEVRKQQKDLAPARILERSHPAAAEKLRMRYKTYNDELELAKHYEAEGKVLILAPEDLYGLNTLKKNFEGLEMMYRKGYAAAEAIPAFLQA